MTDSTPTFAIVGAVNHGKSSVVSTLSEDDSIGISAMPGSTVESRRFDWKGLFRFFDTPGFQNARDALIELEAARNTRTPMAVFKEFLARHQSNPDFDAECRLLQPIVEGAGIVYVVDGSQPLSPLHEAEMEILRLTGQPRLAVINRTRDDYYLEDWKRKLGSHFNAVREFNAHSANYADRLELLETLASIEQSWKPNLMQAVAIFEEQLKTRLMECAEIMVELLVFCLQHREAKTVAQDVDRKQIGEELKKHFMTTISAREVDAHRRIIEEFRHRRVKAESAPDSLFDSELFSDETFKLFGLNEKQLVATSAGIGATVGAATDLLTAGSTLFAGAAIGTAIGALSGYALGKNRPDVTVAIPGTSKWFGRSQGVSLGGMEVSVGPYTAVNFPWILLDRSIGTFLHVVNRAHARQDEVTISSVRLKSMMESTGVSTEKWEPDLRKKFSTNFNLIRKNSLGPDQKKELRDLIQESLQKVTRIKVPASDM